MFSIHKLTSEEQRAFHKFEQHYNLCSEQTIISPRHTTLNMIINEGKSIYLNGHVTPPNYHVNQAGNGVKHKLKQLFMIH